MNTVMLRGRLTAAPEVKITDSEDQKIIAKFALAVPDKSRKKDGGGFEADFVRIVAFNKHAETAQSYLNKGSEVIVVGRLHTYKYQKNDATHYGSEVIASAIEFVSRCGNSDSNDFSFMENISNEELPFA